MSETINAARYWLDELETLLGIGRVNFTQGEQSFMESLAERDLSKLSQRQLDVLEKMYEEKTA